MQIEIQPFILRNKQVLAMTGYSKSTLYNRINAELFCPPIPLSCRTVGFVYDEVQFVMKAIIAGYSEDEIKMLVRSLVDKRPLSFLMPKEESKG